MRHSVETPVHVFGYNWTGSNDDAGKQLAAYIEEVIAFYKCQGRICEHVILITHSMGGLVARSACKLHGAESKVLGVVHGVQLFIVAQSEAHVVLPAAVLVLDTDGRVVINEVADKAAVDNGSPTEEPSPSRNG